MMEGVVGLMGDLEDLALPHLTRMSKAGDFLLEGRRRLQSLGQLRLLLDKGLLLLPQGGVLEVHLLEVKRREAVHVGRVGGLLLLQRGTQPLQLDPAGRLELLLLRLKKVQLLLELVAGVTQGIPLHGSLAQPDLELGDPAISPQVLGPQLVVSLRLSVIKLLPKKQKEAGLRFGLVKI